MVSWSGRPCEQLEASSPPSGQWASVDDTGKAMVLDDASGHWEPGERAVISTCPLKNVTNALEGESECCGTTGVPNPVLHRCWDMGLLLGWSQVRAGLLGMFLPREQSEPCLPAVGGTSESALMSSGSFRDASNTPESPGVSRGTGTRESVTSSFLAEVTVPSTCPLKNTTNTHGTSGELHGTIAATNTAHRMFSALPVPLVTSGVEFVSRNTYINRKKLIRETCWRQSKALKKVQCEAKRELVAQLEISHEATEVILRSQAPRTDEKFPAMSQESRLPLQQGPEQRQRKVRQSVKRWQG